MIAFDITEQQRRELYDEVKRATPHSDIYWPDHVFPIARNCRVYATYLSQKLDHPWDINPTLCELGGLLHDIGYTKEYESIENDHITRGVRFARDILTKVGITDEPLERIIDIIWTHDGNLTRSAYQLPPQENILVNDVDAMQFFDWPFPSMIEFSKRLRSKEEEKEIIRGIKIHADHTYSLMYSEFFKNLARPKYHAFVENLKIQFPRLGL